MKSKKDKNRKRCSFFLCVLIVAGCFLGNVFPVHASDGISYGTTYSDMLERAEEIVNYSWTPSKDIEVWNDNPYNGKNYFPANTEVVGMPYTLFTNEVVEDSLLSLAEFKKVQADNYSTTANCKSLNNAERTGPVYGSCCATFISEVFGGSFMSGDTPLYDSVSGIRNSGYAVTSYNVKAIDFEKGDAVSNSSGSHIIWIGDINEDTMIIYEQTPPVARKVTLSIAENIDENGYLQYEDTIFNVVTKSLEYMSEEPEQSDQYPVPVIANTISKDKTYVYGKIGGTVAKNNKIYGKNVGSAYQDDECTIDKIYDNGWCHVVFPLTGGATDSGYVELSVFFNNPYNQIVTKKVKNITTLYARSDLEDQLSEISAATEIMLVGEDTEGENSSYQILYGVTSSLNSEEIKQWKLGWIDINTEFDDSDTNETEDDILYGDANGDGTVNGKDIIRLCKYLSEYDAETETSSYTIFAGADVNQDGLVNGKDLIRLAKILAE